MDGKKIVIYHPDNDLKEKVKRLSREKYSVIGVVGADTEEIAFNDFDYVCIPLNNYRETKEKLSSFIDPGIVHTYEELRVLGSEDEVNKRIIKKWERNFSQKSYCFENKTVIVFGGGSGIGYACAEAFVLSGAKVIISGRNENKLRDTAEKIGHNVLWMQWDITNVKHNDEKLRNAIALAGKRIDVVVNSAGLYDSDEVSFFDVTEEVYDAVMDTNIKASFFLCQTFAKYFIDETIPGHIVNIVSETGNAPTVKPYGISKWGLWGFTKGLGLTLAKYNITVNGVAPGEVATDMTGWGGDRKKREPARRAPQTGRVLFSREVAECVLFLAGCAGENMPGEIILYNGGSVGGYIGFNY